LSRKVGSESNPRPLNRVADPQIDEVMDLETGNVAPAEFWVSGDCQQGSELRMGLMQELRAGRPVAKIQRSAPTVRGL
jgi:hypothetical protein